MLAVSRHRAGIAGLVCNHHHRAGGDFCSSCRLEGTGLRTDWGCCGAPGAGQTVSPLLPASGASPRGASVLGRRLRLCPPSSSWIGRPFFQAGGLRMASARGQVNFPHRPRALRHQAHTSCLGRHRSRWLGGRTRCARCGCSALRSGLRGWRLRLSLHRRHIDVGLADTNPRSLGLFAFDLPDLQNAALHVTLRTLGTLGLRWRGFRLHRHFHSSSGSCGGVGS